MSESSPSDRHEPADRPARTRYRGTVKFIHTLTLAPLLVVLLAADCRGGDDGEAPPPAPCDVIGGCGGVDREGPLVGGGGTGNVDVIDDGRQAPAVRGVYLDDLDGVLASATRTDALVRWLAAGRFDRVDCYDLGTVLSSSTLTTRLSTFLGRLRRETAVVHVSAVIGSTRVLDAVRVYQSTHDDDGDDGDGFDGLTLEHEWWNGAGTFRAHERLLDAMHAVADASGLAVDDYVGWFQRPGDDDGDGRDDVTAAQMAASLAGRVDTLLVHAYRQAPDAAVLQSRLALLNDAAAARGARLAVVVLFSAEDGDVDANDFMGDWYAARPFDDAWDVLVQQRVTMTPTPHLSLVGHQVFAASMAMRARPQP